jgi:endonuclease YncB( thermonuclease family)
MRRDVWLAGVAGAVVGSWLTLVAVQFGGHGFDLHGRRGSTTTAENKSNSAAKPAETPKQSDTALGKSQPENQSSAQVASSTPDKPSQSSTTPSSTASDGNPELSAAAMAAAAAATPVPATDEAAGTPGDAAAKAEAGKAAPQDNKVATDPVQLDNAPAKPAEVQNASVTPDASKSKDSTSGQTAQSIEAAATKPATSAQPAAPAEEAKADPVPNNRIPADQIDRQTAATEHQTLLPQSQQPVQPEPQSAQAAVDPASKPQGQTTTIELVRPFSDQAGMLTISGRSVQLTGVIPTEVDRMCTGPSGSSWPCGQAARTAFRMYLRGRSIDCDVPDADWKGTVTGACRYVRIDLSAWLVRFGWADPEPGSPLSALVDEAKQKKRGMYGDDPRKNGKSTLAPTPPKEDPLNPI